MKAVTRRLFIKSLAGVLLSLSVGWYLITRFFRPLQRLNPEKAASLSGEEGILVVSDVDSHSQCALRIRIKDRKVTDIRGVPEDPESKGEMTLRDRHFRDILYAPDRLRYPMKRVGKKGEGQWERISWDEALSTIADRFAQTKKEYGAEAISFHHGHYHSGDILGTYLPRLANLIGTPNVSNTSHICHMPRVTMQFNFDLGVVVPPDVKHTKCLLLWGGNPRATNKAQEIAISEARKRGVKLIVIDPRKTAYAREADIHAQLRPGTDGALALGMLHVIIGEELYDKSFVTKWTTGFEELKQLVKEYTPEKTASITWVPENVILEMARMYANAKPACISPRNALDQHTNTSAAIRAVNALMAVTGNLDVKGGNVIVVPISMGLKDLKAYDRLPPEAEAKKIGADRCLYAKISKTWPSALTPMIWDAVNEERPYPIKNMFVMAANPASTCANADYVVKALKKLDFLVVADLFLTPTAAQADIVLPATTYREPAESPVSKPELAKEFPLVLIAGTKLEAYTHSMMRNIPSLNRECPKNLLEIHPETAAKLGIASGDTARISSPRGSVTCAAQVTDGIDPRVVHLYHGFEDCNCNVLTDHKAFDPITGSTGLKSLLCRVEKA